MYTRPLFPGYLFFRGESSSSSLLSVLKIPGVVRILGLAPPVITTVPEKQIEAIRQLEGSGLPSTAVPYLRLGELVRIKDGPLAGAEGIVQKYRGKNWLVISVDLLQRSIALELEGWRLEQA